MSAFSVFTDRKRRKKNTQTPTVEQYYHARVHRLAQVRWFCLLFTVLFLVYGFAVHGEDLTADNFRYMLRFLDFADEEKEEGETEIRFDYAERNRGILYKGDVAVLNGDGLSVYDWNGNRLFSRSFRMEDPRLFATGQSLFAYDLGGNEVRAFGSHSEVAKLSMQYPVYGFDACEGGNFAVITSEANYRTAVIVYNSEFLPCYRRLFSDTYVDQIALSPNGSRFLALGHEAKNGDLLTILQGYALDTEQPLFSRSFTDELPLKVAYLSDRTYAVLTGTALRIYTEGNEEPDATLPIGQLPLKNCLFRGGNVLLTYSAEGLSGGTVLCVYDQALQQIHTSQYEGDIRYMDLQSNELCVLTMGEVRVTDLKTEQETRYSVGKDAKSVLYDGERWILFEKGRAAYLRAEDVSTGKD